MKIESKQGFVRFIDIPQGECFRDEGASIYMKTEAQEDESNGYINAVDLEDGTFTYFDAGEQVEKLHAKVVFET